MFQAVEEQESSIALNGQESQNLELHGSEFDKVFKDIKTRGDCFIAERE